MPKFEVVFTERAQKDLSDLPEYEIDQILASCLRLETNPHPDGKHIKKLKGYKDLYRLSCNSDSVKKKWMRKTSPPLFSAIRLRG